MKVSLLTLAVFLCKTACGIHLDTAFERDWTEVTFGTLENVIELSSNHTFGVDANKYLYKLDVNDRVKYYIDLALHDGKSYELVGPYIATFSDNNKVSFHREASGIYVDSISLKAPLQQIAYGPNGVFVLLQDNSVTLWNGEASFSLGKVDGSEISIHQYDLDVYIVSNDSLYKLVGDELVEEAHTFPKKNLKPVHSSARIKKNHKIGAAPAGRAVLVPKPDSIAKIEKSQHLQHELTSASLSVRYFLKLKDHALDLGQFIYSLKSPQSSAGVLENDDEYHVGSLLVYFNDEHQLLTARDTTDGSLLWTTELPTKGPLLNLLSRSSNIIVVSEFGYVLVNSRDGTVVSSEEVSQPIQKVFELSTADGFETSIGVKLPEGFKILFDNSLVSSQYLLETQENGLQGYKLLDQELIPTWKLNVNEALIAVSRNGKQVSNAVGIPRYDRSVLHKFLNPNLIAALTSSESALGLTLLDGVLGRVYFEQIVSSDKVAFDTAKIVQRDNWVVVSYVSQNDAPEQRIVVYDLFTDSTFADNDKISSFDHLAVNVSSKSFIYPERIAALAVTDTKFGISTKSVLIFTEEGNLVEVPKHILNSRRIDDHKLTQNDFMDDFKMTPYQPVIQKDASKVLNHKLKLRSDGSDQILVQPTELESTAVVCVVNSINQFCSIVLPSLSYDILSASFPKMSLILTLIALLAAYLVSKSFVSTKKLQDKWLD